MYTVRHSFRPSGAFFQGVAEVNVVGVEQQFHQLDVIDNLLLGPGARR